MVDRGRANPRPERGDGRGAPLVAAGTESAALLAAIPDPALVVGVDGQLRRWNARLASVTALDEAELSDANLLELVVADHRNRVAAALADAAAVGTASGVQFDLRCPDAAAVPHEFYAAALRDVDGDARAVAVVAREVTDRAPAPQTQHERVVETVLDGVYASDKDGRLVMVNEALCEMAGLPREEMLGRLATEFVSSGEDADVWKLREEVVAGERDIATSEMTLQRSDGSALPAEVRFTRHTFPDGETGTVGIVRDVRDRQERQRELERYERIVEAAGDGLYTMDRAGRYTDVNDFICEITGYEREEILGRTAELFMDESDVEESADAVRELLRGDSTVATVEQEIETADGDMVYCEDHISLLTDEDGFAGTMGVVRDVTDRVAYERELERYERVVKTVGDGVYALDAERRFVMVNDAFCELSGYSREELVGEHGSVVVDDADLAAVEEAHRGLRESDGAVATVEETLRCADGTAVPIETRISHFPLDDGVGRVGVVRDVSERKARERELCRQRDELDTLNRINGAIQDVIEALVDAGTREEIEQTVCERLAASELYCGVWIGRHEGGDATVEFVEGVGEATRVDRRAAAPDVDGECPATACVRTGEARVSRRGDPGSLFRGAETPTAVQASAAVPLAYRDVVYGALVVYSPRADAFSEREQSAFNRLGEVIGFAFNAVRTERLLLSNTLTELEFDVTDRDAFLIRLSAVHDCRCSLEWALPVGDGEVVEYVTVDGATADAVREEAAAAVEVVDCQVISEHDDGCRLAVSVTDSAAQRLVAAGANVTGMYVEGGAGRATAEVSQDANVRGVVDALLDVYDDAELAAKRVVERPTQSASELRRAVADGLTEKQCDALRAAFHAGYFEWPRSHTAEEVADTLDVTSATLHYHLRNAQRELVAAFFDE